MHRPVRNLDRSRPLSAEWTHPFDALPNLRDLASAAPHRLRSGVIFRSAVPAFASPQDIARLRDLGITQVIDLRGPQERDELPPLQAEGIDTHAIPLFDRTWDLSALDPADDSVATFLAERYVELLDTASHPIADVLQTVAHHDGATLIHCTAGKDRTGVVMAILAAFAGVSRTDIVIDYVRTMDAMPELATLLGEHHRQKAGTHMGPTHASAAGKAVLMSAPAAAIEAVLDRVHAQPAEYLHSIGIERALRTQLSTRLSLPNAA